MSTPFIGEICAFAATYYPGDDNWLPCNGQLVSCTQYQALFSLIRNIYGGDGVKTFALPNLNGVAILGTGQAQGSPNKYIIGQKTGQTTVTLTPTQMPVHNHTITGINAQAMDGPPTSTSHLSRILSGKIAFAYSDQALPGNNALASAALPPYAGGSQPHENMQPWLGFTYAIAINGVYPMTA